MSTSIVIALIVIAALIVIFYVVAMVLRRRAESRIIDLEERKEDLFDLPVQDEIDAVKQMHLVGQSQTIFREWNQKWIDLSFNSFSDLENHILEAESLNDSFRFIQAKEAIDASESQLALMEEDVQAIRDALADLVEQEKKNSTKIQDSLDLYDNLRSKILDNASDYGSAIKEIEKQLTNIELEFSQFVTLNSTGDPIEAREVLETAEEHTIALEKITDRIPEMITRIEGDYPKQVSGLETAYEQIIDEGYKLPASLDVKKTASKAKADLAAALEAIERFELDKADEHVQGIEASIDATYLAFEKEYKAKKHLEKQSKILKDYIEHTKSNNKNLLLEIDHASQSYTLSNNEMSAVRNYQEQLEGLDKDADDFLEGIETISHPYSILDKRLGTITTAIADIESGQLKINEDLASLRSQEKLAQEKLDDFDFKIRTIKRYVDKQNLPGLPRDYMDVFLMTGERIQTLSQELNKVRINMDTVNYLQDMATEDMSDLAEKTTNLVDDAVLAEQLMQYANRYRTTDHAISDAIDESMLRFEREHNYSMAFDIIFNALEAKEPGAAARIAASYQKHREVPDYQED